MPTIDQRTPGRFKDVAGIRQRRVATYTGPSSYVTGGDSFTNRDIALGKIEMIHFELAVNSSGTVRGVHYDHTNAKARWVVLDTGSEVANGTDLSGFSARFEALGL